MWNLAHLMLEHIGKKKAFLPIPVPICKALAGIMEFTMKRPPLTRYGISRIKHEAASDNSEAREDLGYAPIGVSDGFKLCKFELS